MDYIKKLIDLFKVKVLRMQVKDVNAIRPYTEKEVDILLDSLMLSECTGV